jgi:hypothetical protein
MFMDAQLMILVVEAPKGLGTARVLRAAMRARWITTSRLLLAEIWSSLRFTGGRSPIRRSLSRPNNLQAERMKVRIVSGLFHRRPGDPLPSSKGMPWPF